MSAAVLPLSLLHQGKALGTSIEERPQSVPFWLRWILVMFLPSAIDGLVKDYSNDMLASMSKEQSGEALRRAKPLYDATSAFLHYIESRPGLKRTAARLLFANRLKRSLDQLADTIEALEWGASDSLREQIDSAVLTLQS